MLLIIALVFFLLLCLHLSIRYSRAGKMLKNIPGPPTIPIVGNALDFLCSPVEVFYYGRSMAKIYDIYILWFFGDAVVNVIHPDDCEVVLSSPKHISKSLSYTLLHPWLGEGLLTSNGNKWRSRRKLLTPTFHFNILRQFCEVFSEESVKLAKRLNSEVEKEETDLFHYISDFSLRVICETAMGISLDSLPNLESDAYIHNTQEISKYIVYRMMRVWLFPPKIYAMTKAAKEQKRVLSVLHKFTDDVIRERKSLELNTDKDFYPENETSNDNGDVSKKKRLAMLDLLLSLESRGKIDKEAIREEVDTFLFEGHDTTTTALTCLLMELANNKEIQRKVVEELEEIYQDADDVMTMEKLNKMTYLDRCIKEAVRLYPSGSFIGREITEDMQLKNFLIPAGTTIHLHIFDLHRRPEIYPDPDRFDPDRFLPENCIKRHPFAYIPFSAGPRNCIGQKFAVLEMKACVSTILRHFKLEPITKPDKVLFKADVVLKPATPIKVKFLPKNHNHDTAKDLMIE